MSNEREPLYFDTKEFNLSREKKHAITVQEATIQKNYAITALRQAVADYEEAIAHQQAYELQKHRNKPILIRNKKIKNIETDENYIYITTFPLFVEDIDWLGFINLLEDPTENSGVRSLYDLDYYEDEEYEEIMDDIMDTFNLYPEEHLADMRSNQNNYKIYVGQFIIQIEKMGNEIIFRNLDQKETSYWDIECHHPHIDNYGKACFGNAEFLLMETKATGNYEMFFDTLVNFLCNANIQDCAGVNVVRWPLLKVDGDNYYSYNYSNEDFTDSFVITPQEANYSIFEN